MEDHILKTRKVREPAFSAVYVWIDPYDESFESYMKKHMMRTLGWACSNEDLKERLDMSHGDPQVVIMQLSTKFKQEFNGNIGYLQEIFSIETVQMMILLIQDFIKSAVEEYATASQLPSAGNTQLN